MAIEADLFYRLDGENNIVEVGGKWDDFAEQNNGAKAFAKRIVGTQLFTHISGTTSRDFVWTMIDAVRKTGKPSVKSYRCDGPEIKRFMEMTIVPEEAAHVRVEHRLLRIETRSVRAAFTTGHGASGRVLIRCSMCNRVRAKGRWLEIEQAVAANSAGAQDSYPVAYGVCGSCRESASQPPYSRGE